MLFAYGLTASLLGIASAALCELSPLGVGLDDTDQVESAIAECGHNGATVFNEGTYNITRKMMWDLESSTVDLYGYLSFTGEVESWLQPENTYRVVFIQNQASWFVLTGSDFVVDAHNVGGVQGNGQPWWNYFTSHTKADGDGRPIALTVWQAARAIVKNFRIESQPFWCNTVAESVDVTYDGMMCNATNLNTTFAGTNIVPNTDGINTYRSDDVKMLNWDITCGDDCLAIKGNSSNILARNITCHGGNGIAFGSLGQYANLSDNVWNVLMDDIKVKRIASNLQPNMANGIYLKSWTGTVNGVPPTGGGGGTGNVTNITLSNVYLEGVNRPLHLYQTNGGHSADLPSQLTFNNLTFTNWTGTAATNAIVDIECSSAVGCDHVVFSEFNVTGPTNGTNTFVCKNVFDLEGLGVPCT